MPAEDGTPRCPGSGRAEELGADLWRWTTPHPAWRPGHDRPGGWERDVSCVLFARGETVTIVDPLAGADDDALWRFLDERAGAARRVVVALTAPWHRPSAADVAGRYGAEVRVHARGAARAGLSGAHPFDDDGEVAPCVHALTVAGSDDGEVAYWLPRPGALVTAEVLLGTRAGLRLAESPALDSRAELHAWLRGPDRLPVRLVVPSHGPPAPDGRAAIRAALARPPWGTEASA